MRVKVDENLSWEVAEDLLAAGHDADTVHDEGLVGGVDPTVLARARADRRVLVTLDKGIADVRAYPPDQYAGIVLLRPPSTGFGRSPGPTSPGCSSATGRSFTRSPPPCT